jgi:hypothetical protein
VYAIIIECQGNKVFHLMMYNYTDRCIWGFLITRLTGKSNDWLTVYLVLAMMDTSITSFDMIFDWSFLN